MYGQDRRPKHTYTGEIAESGVVEMHLRREGYGTMTVALGRFGEKECSKRGVTCCGA
jgi:hypothetical protein